MKDRDPARAPGIQPPVGDRRQWRLMVGLPDDVAEVLAANWERSGETPAACAMRILIRALRVAPGVD